MTPLIQEPETSRRLAKAFGIRGQLAAPELDYVITPVCIVADVREPDPFRGVTVRNFAVGLPEFVVAPNFAHVMLFNPSASQVVCQLHHLSVLAGGNEVFIGRLDSQVGFTLGSRGFQTNDRTRGVGTGTSQAEIDVRDDPVQTIPNEMWHRVTTLNTQSGPCWNIPATPWFIYPGQGIVVTPIVSASLVTSWEWSERPLEPRQ